eukprot:411630_1
MLTITLLRFTQLIHRGISYTLHVIHIMEQTIVYQEMYFKDDMDANEDEEKKEDEMVIFRERESNKNYIYLNVDNNIIAIHPTNPSWDFLHVARNTHNGTNYCLSRNVF